MAAGFTVRAGERGPVHDRLRQLDRRRGGAGHRHDLPGGRSGAGLPGGLRPLVAVTSRTRCHEATHDT